MKIYFITIGVFVFVVVLLQILIIYKRKRIENESLHLKKIADDNEKLYQDMAEANRQLKNVKHDLKKQRDIVRELVESSYRATKTGVATLDIIINKKKNEALESNIYFNEDVHMLSKWGIKDSDTVSLMTNILDNAIEAAKLVKDNSPIINLKIYQKIDRIYIQLENSKQSDKTPILNQFTSTKEDASNHGLGIGIIKEIISKYDGTIDMEDEVEKFKVNIVI